MGAVTEGDKTVLAVVLVLLFEPPILYALEYFLLKWLMEWEDRRIQQRYDAWCRECMETVAQSQQMSGNAAGKQGNKQPEAGADITQHPQDKD